MIPQKRLETLLEQAKEYQRTQCRYHASEPPISLFSDHVCDRSVFPTVTTHILGGHSDEVWRVEFSHDGTRLASAGQDGKVLIWKVDVRRYIDRLQGV
jgi:WD40 repeat protein